MPNYTVKQGDCIESIADAFGLLWQRIWNDPANAGIRELRQIPNVLLPGDIVYIPELTLREESCTTDRRHFFVLNRPYCKLVIVLKDFGKPRADEPYILTVEGCTVTGKTGSDGKLETKIPPGAHNGRLVVGAEGKREQYVLKLGHIDPISEEGGIEKRLTNLGYESLTDFQKRRRLPLTGQPDETTVNQLRDEYGC
jgi:hypothetical protein